MTAVMVSGNAPVKGCDVGQSWRLAVLGNVSRVATLLTVRVASQSRDRGGGKIVG